MVWDGRPQKIFLSYTQIWKLPRLHAPRSRPEPQGLRRPGSDSAQAGRAGERKRCRRACILSSTLHRRVGFVKSGPSTARFGQCERPPPCDGREPSCTRSRRPAERCAPSSWLYRKRSCPTGIHRGTAANPTTQLAVQCYLLLPCFFLSDRTDPNKKKPCK